MTFGEKDILGGKSSFASASAVMKDSRKPMRVCFVSAFPPSRGRLSEYGWELSRALAERKEISRVDVIGDGVTVDGDRPKLRARNIWLKDQPQTFFKILLNILKLRSDIVHFNLHLAVFGKGRLTNFLGLLLPFATRLLGFKVVVTLHNLAERIDLRRTGLNTSIANRLGLLVATKLLVQSGLLIVTMRSYVNVINLRYRSNNVYWMPHGTWNVKRKASGNLNGNIITLGYLAPHKDLKLLTESFKTCILKKPDLKLTIACSSHPNFDGLEKIREDLFKNGVTWTGYLKESELPDMLGSSSLMVLPYHTCTGSSGVLHLAASYGLPVLATDLPEMRELASEGAGLFLTKPTPKEMSSKIQFLIDNPEILTGLGERNLRFAKERTWDKLAERHIEVYSKLLAGE